MSDKRDAEWATAFALAVGPSSGLHAPLIPEAVKDCIDQLLARERAATAHLLDALKRLDRWDVPGSDVVANYLSVNVRTALEKYEAALKEGK